MIYKNNIKKIKIKQKIHLSFIMINYNQDIEMKIITKTKNKKDIDFYIEFQDLFTRRKQKEAIEKGIY